MRRGVSCGLVAALTLTLAVGVGDASVGAEETPTRTPGPDCLEAATTLSDEQLLSLRRGEEIRVSEDRFGYMEKLVEDFAPSTWQDLVNDSALEGDGSGPGNGEARLRANALLLITNPHVRIDDEIDVVTEVDGERFHGCADAMAGVEISGERGSIHTLPFYLRTALTSAPIEWDSLGPWEAEKPELLTEDELTAAGRFLSAADEEIAQGSDINRVLLGRAGEIADVAVDQGIGNFRSEGYFFDFSHERVGDLLAAMIGAAGRDHIAFADVVLGKTDVRFQTVIPEGSYGPFTRDGRSEFRPVTYHPSTAIPALLAFDWDEAAGQDQPLVRALRDIGTSGVKRDQVEDRSSPASDEVVWENGNEMGRALARIVMDRSAMLTRIPGYNDQPVGMVNPLVTNALAAATVPYALEVTGRYEGSVMGGRRGQEGGIQKLATVVSTSDVALQTLVSTEIDMVSQIQQRYATLPEEVDLSNEDSDSRYKMVLEHIRLEKGVARGIGEGLSLVAEAGGADESYALEEGGMPFSSNTSAIPESAAWKRPTVSFDEDAVTILSEPAPYPREPRPGKLTRAGVKMFTGNPTSAWTLVNLVYPAPENVEDLVAEFSLDDSQKADSLNTSSLRFRMMASEALGELDDRYLRDYTLYKANY